MPAKEDNTWFYLMGGAIGLWLLCNYLNPAAAAGTAASTLAAVGGNLVPTPYLPTSHTTDLTLAGGRRAPPIPVGSISDRSSGGVMSAMPELQDTPTLPLHTGPIWLRTPTFLGPPIKAVPDEWDEPDKLPAYGPANEAQGVF